MNRARWSHYLVATGLALSGLVLVARADPPPWAPAHGYRAKQQYRYVYYPQQGVYYSPESRVWFWAGGQGWQVGASLPTQYRQGIAFSASVGTPQGGVSVVLDTDKPYLQNDYVVQQYGGPSKHGHGHGHGNKHGDNDNQQ